METIDIHITMPKSWSDVAPALRRKYIRVLSSKGEVAAAMRLAKGCMGRRAYRQLQRYGTDDHIYGIVEAVDAIPDTTPIVDTLPDGSRFPLPHFKSTPLIVFAKADEVYGYLRAAVESGAVSQVQKHSYRLLRILTTSCTDYHRYMQDIERPYTARQEKKLAAYVHVALRYFTASKLYIHEQYGALLFSGGGGSAAAGIDLGWHGTAMSVAKTGVYGNLYGTYMSHLHAVLLFLVKEKQDAAQQQKAMKAAQR